MKPYSVKLARAAQKDLANLPKKVVERVVPKIRDLATDPRPKDSIKLAGKVDTFRIRVGKYRVIYEIHDDQILVLIVRIRHRKDAYQ